MLTFSDLRAQYDPNNSLTDDELIGVTAQHYGTTPDVFKQAIEYVKPEPEGGLIASAKNAFGAMVKGAGQAASDFIPGVGDGNAVKRYGQGIVDANPTAVHSLSDIADKPLTAGAEAVGNAAGSVGQMLGVRAVGQGITALSPLTGPAAPAVALLGQAVSWLGPAAVAALPSYGGIRDKQILTDPQNEADWRAKTIATLGAATVGAIESKFGPQQWALSAMTKEGRAAIAEKFAETTLAKGIGFGALKGAAIEGAEELVQNPIEQLAGFDDPRTPENLKETAFGGAMGAIGGGVLGGGFGAAFRGNAKPKVDPVPDILDSPNIDDAISTFVAANQEITPAAINAGQQFKDLGITTPADDLAMQRVQSEREGAAASQARDQRLNDVGQAWQDLGITNPANDLQAQRAGLRPTEGQDVSANAPIQPLPTSSTGRGGAEPGIGLEAALGRDATTERAVGGGLPGDVSAGEPVAPADRGNADAVDANANAGIKSSDATPQAQTLKTATKADASGIYSGIGIQAANLGGRDRVYDAGQVHPLDEDTKEQSAKTTPSALADKRGADANAVEPAVTWLGRSKAGYESEADATQAKDRLASIRPDLDVQIEQMPSGKFRLAGYADSGVKFDDGKQTQSSNLPPAIRDAVYPAEGGIDAIRSGASDRGGARLDIEPGAREVGSDAATSGKQGDRVFEGKQPGAPSFDFTRNDSGTLTVFGPPDKIRAAGITGITQFKDGKPTGILVSVKSAPDVIAQLEESRVQNNPENPANIEAAPVEARAEAPAVDGRAPGQAAEPAAGSGAVQAVNLPAMNDIRQPKESVANTAASLSNSTKVLGNKTVPIDSLVGGVGDEVSDQKRVKDLAAKLSQPDAYIERLIVDDAGNVIEGQHRLDALRSLGVKDVPVVVIQDFERNFPTDKVKEAIAATQKMPSDNANQLAAHLAEIYADEKGSIAEMRQYEAPAGFQKAWDAGIAALESNQPQGTPNAQAQKGQSETAGQQAPAADPRLIPVSQRAPKPDLTPEQQAELGSVLAQDFEKQYQRDIKDGIKRKRGLIQDDAGADKRTPLKSFLVEHGVSDSPSDVVGEKNAYRANQILPRMFRKDGLGIDELAIRAEEAGFISQRDLDSGDGVTKLKGLIEQEFSGNKQYPADMADDAAADAYERNRRMDIEDHADSLGLPHDSDIKTDVLASMVARVERYKAQPRNKAGLLKPDRVLKNAQETVARIEKKRAQYEAQDAEFAGLTIAEQDALLDALTDADGNPVVVRRTEIEAEAAWQEAQTIWSEQYGQAYTPEDGAARQTQASAAGVTKEGVGDDSQAGAAEQRRGDQASGASAQSSEGLTAPTREDVLAQQADLEAEKKRREDGGDKPIAAKPFTTDQVDLFNPQASIFDAPADPIATAVQAMADAVKGLQTALAPKAADKMDAENGGKYTGPADVSSRSGQMELANRGGTIATLKALNAQLRAIDPNEAWADKNIEESNDLDGLRDKISTALVKAQRAEPVQEAGENPLRVKLEELSGADLKDVFAKLNLAGKHLTHSERVEMLLQEDAKEVEAAIDATAAQDSAQPAAMPEDDAGNVAMFSRSEPSEGYSILNDPTEEEAQAVQAGVEGKTAVEAAEFIAKNATEESHRLVSARVAVRLKQLEAVGAKFTFNVSHVGKELPDHMLQAGVRGYTLQHDGDETTQIWVNGADVTGVVGTSYETVLHELVHAATQKAIDLGEHGAPGEIGVLVQELYKAFDHVYKHVRGKMDAGGELNDFEQAFHRSQNNSMKNMHEMVAWTLTNKETQNYLETIPYKKTTAWGEFVAALRRFFGMKADTESVLSEVLRISDNLMGLKATDLLRASIQQNVHMQKNYVRSRSDGSGRAIMNFSRSVITGQTSRQHTPEQLRAMKNVGFQVEVPTLKERAQALWKDAGKKMAQGIVDQFAPVKDMDRQAYGLLRLAKGASGAFEAFMHGGKLKLTDGVYDFDDANKGGVVDKLLIPLQGEHHDFMRWIAANRAERLLSEGRENLFSPQDIADLKTLANGTTGFDYTIQTGPQAGTMTRDRTKVYADSQRIFNEFNKNALDMAEQSGLIDPESRKLWESEFYVPFYRVADDSDGGIRGMNIKSGVVRQQAIKQLKGGKNALNADLLDNTLMNWAHLLDAAAKNRAAKATLEAAERMGIAISAPQYTATHMASAAESKAGLLWVMDGGVKRFYVLDQQVPEGPFILTALTALEYAGMRNPVMNAMSTFKHALTIGVTASPFFKVRNLIRDSVQVLGTSKINPNPIANVAQGWKLTDPKSDAYFRLLAGGGTIHFGTMLEGSEAKRIQSLVESGVKDATLLSDQHKVKAFYRKYIEPGITAYNELGNRGEAINRASLYDQLVKGGMNHADASLQARDLMDFSMNGSFTTIRFLTQTVPFMNARIQGLYKLGRSAKEDPARFSAVVGAAALMSIALLAAYGDDDDWKRRTESDRQNFWWFKFGGTAFRIPKPFEIGAIATLAERGFELAFDKQMTGERFRKQVLSLLSDNLSMNPVPQLVKPILDVYANKDSFSGRPIETMGMDKLKSEYRFNDRTSMTARAVSTSANAVSGLVGVESLSPVQIDHMLRGYFGWLGAFVVGAGDIVARPATGQTDRASADMWKTATGNIVSDLRDAPSRYVGQMYEQAKEIEQAYGTYRALQKEGKATEAAEFAKDNRDKLAKYRSIEGVKRAEAKLNERRRIIERSNMDGDAKRDLIRQISAQQERIARNVVEVR